MTDFVTWTLAVPGIISTIGSFFIVITYLLFRKIRTLKFIELIVCVAFSDIFASLGYAIGLQHNHTGGCYVQGLFNNYFSISSLSWGVLLSLSLLHLANTGRIYPTTKLHHIICWGFPLLVVGIPLYWFEFGYIDDIQDGWGLCNLVVATRPGVSELSLMAINVYLFGVIWLLIIAILIIFSFTVYRMYSNGMMTHPDISNTIKTLFLYPFIMIFSWLGITIIYLISISEPAILSNRHDLLIGNTVSTFMMTIPGFLNSLIFGYRNTLVKNEWFNFFQKTQALSSYYFSWFAFSLGLTPTEPPPFTGKFWSSAKGNSHPAESHPSNSSHSKGRTASTRSGTANSLITIKSKASTNGQPSNIELSNVPPPQTTFETAPHCYFETETEDMMNATRAPSLFERHSDAELEVDNPLASASVNSNPIINKQHPSRVPLPSASIHRPFSFPIHNTLPAGPRQQLNTLEEEVEGEEEVDDDYRDGLDRPSSPRLDLSFDNFAGLIDLDPTLDSQNNPLGISQHLERSSLDQVI